MVDLTDRTLVLLRHAKAQAPTVGSDAERPLTPRGHDDAAAAGAWLAGQTLVPDLVLCSPARRTRETWHAVATALGAGATGVSTSYDPRIYAAGGAGDLLALVVAADPRARVVLVIGHNPTLSMVSAALDPADGPELGLRTAGLAVHRVQGDWSDYVAGRAQRIASHTARA